MHQTNPASETEPAVVPPRPSGGSSAEGSSTPCALAPGAPFGAAPVLVPTVGGEGERDSQAAGAARRADDLAQLASPPARFRWRDKSGTSPDGARTRAEATVQARAGLGCEQDLAGPLPGDETPRQAVAGPEAMSGGAGTSAGRRLGAAETISARDRPRAFVPIASAQRRRQGR